MIEKTYNGIPRKKIPWYPIIDYNKCISCAKCFEFCHNQVFEVEEKNGKKRIVVKSPYNCVVLCTGCQPECPVGAITHPSEKETLKLIEALKK
jgi:NAD-dependent dihydropyrimidine dehydrogenase PreA subunit